MKSVYLWKKGEGVRPLKDIMGITHNGRSEAVSRALSDFGSEESFGQASERFAEHYKYEINASTVLRETKKVADEASEYVEKKLSEAGVHYGDAVTNGHRCDGLVVELDGCELRTAVLKSSDGERKQKREKVINWREVRIGLVRETGCVSKTYIGKMGSYPEVVGQLFNASVLAGMGHYTQVIGIGDGGIGLKEELEVQFPDIQFILDKTHLKDHLYDTAEAIGINEKERREWVKIRPERISRVEAEFIER